jgi:hypothetical protein
MIAGGPGFVVHPVVQPRAEPAQAQSLSVKNVGVHNASSAPVEAVAVGAFQQTTAIKQSASLQDNVDPSACLNFDDPDLMVSFLSCFYFIV